MTQTPTLTAEEQRLAEDAQRVHNWKRWGSYLSERQWATVREDYSADGSVWDYFPHDHARSRVYRWGEDGLLGICDRECRLCFALALWNGQDPILKERLFGLTGLEGNHGEDVKECYFYLDSTPTHSYMKALYKYPQAAFPYTWLIEENRRRSRKDPEFELTDTGIFDHNCYFDVFAEYAKASPDDILIRITVANRASEAAVIHLLPTLWFRNTWMWGQSGEGYGPQPQMRETGDGALLAEHNTLGTFRFGVEHPETDSGPTFLFTNNETNVARLFGAANASPYVKDAFHEYVIYGHKEAVNPNNLGTKAAVYYQRIVPAEGSVTVRLRLTAHNEVQEEPFGDGFERIFTARMHEADLFYKAKSPPNLSNEMLCIRRQAYAGLLWSKQFYNYDVMIWLKGDPTQPPPPDSRWNGRNHDWMHLFNRDVLSIPDKWEYPWYAAWDLSFHMLPFSRIDPDFAKEQLILLLREWYMHPNGEIPAYEFAFSDVNPPVHAWACWRVYKITGARGQRDRLFLERTFQKLLLTFTWWVNRKDITGKHLFAGGFLGLDNVGLFDRSQPLPNGGQLEQADGTAWMAFYCVTMLSIALELASEDHAYEDVASKFFEHFVSIVDAMNSIGSGGLWDRHDGFYYDQLLVDGQTMPLRVRSIVGLIPLCAVEVLEGDIIDSLPGFHKRMNWFLENRKDLSQHISYMVGGGAHKSSHRLLAIPSRSHLVRVLHYLLDENEFLSPYGIRALSRVYLEHPYVFKLGGEEFRISYMPGESTTGLFGGNSNWRGPIWFPVNYILIEALERYHHFYGDTLKVECPTGSGQMMTLGEVAHDISKRLVSIFLPNDQGKRPWCGEDERYATDPNWRNLTLFYEYFHGDNGKGLGASHQTGWTSLVARLLYDVPGHTEDE
ncbi:MAG: hypothetical protein JO202_01750 [Ktedonobacteraceae bacterium]|nr:hypothetical protein [Ktedonobacteraceae bacterium]